MWWNAIVYWVDVLCVFFSSKAKENTKNIIFSLEGYLSS